MGCGSPHPLSRPPSPLYVFNTKFFSEYKNVPEIVESNMFESIMFGIGIAVWIAFYYIVFIEDEQRP